MSKSQAVEAENAASFSSTINVFSIKQSEAVESSREFQRWHNKKCPPACCVCVCVYTETVGMTFERQCLSSLTLLSLPCPLHDIKKTKLNQSCEYKVLLERSGPDRHSAILCSSFSLTFLVCGFLTCWIGCTWTLWDTCVRSQIDFCLVKFLRRLLEKYSEYFVFSPLWAVVIIQWESLLHSVVALCVFKDRLSNTPTAGVPPPRVI